MIVNDALLAAGAERYGADRDSFISMGGTDGAVYGCRIGDRAYVMKFVPVSPQDIPAYAEKQEFASYLAENGIPVAMPVESLNGLRLEQIQGEQELYLVSVTLLAAGQHPSPRNLFLWNDRLFERWGQVMGKMHALTQAYPRWEHPSDDGTVAPPTLIEGWQQEHQFFVQWSKEPRITARWMELYPLLSALPRDRSNYGLVHNDLHPQNFFYHPEARGVHPLTIFDFDVCAYNWFIADIAIAVYHAAANRMQQTLVQRQEATRAFLVPFLHGYRQENQLDEGWLETLPLFMKYRDILLYIALTNSWSEAQRMKPDIKRWLAAKRGRTLRDEPII